MMPKGDNTARTLIVLFITSLLTSYPRPSIASPKPDDKTADKSAEPVGKTIEARDSDRAQLNDLWAAMIRREPVLQFVQKKYAITDSEVTGSDNIFSAALDHAQSGRMVVTCGSQPPNKYEGKTRAPKKLSETEVALYKIAYDAAEKITEAYRCYRNCMTESKTSMEDLRDLQSIVKESKDSAPRDSNLDKSIEYKQSEVAALERALPGFRAKLVDLTSEQDVTRLDKAMEAKGKSPNEPESK